MQKSNDRCVVGAGFLSRKTNEKQVNSCKFKVHISQTYEQVFCSVSSIAGYEDRYYENDEAIIAATKWHERNNYDKDVMVKELAIAYVVASQEVKWNLYFSEDPQVTIRFSDSTKIKAVWLILLRILPGIDSPVITVNVNQAIVYDKNYLWSASTNQDLPQVAMGQDIEKLTEEVTTLDMLPFASRPGTNIWTAISYRYQSLSAKEKSIEDETMRAAFKVLLQSREIDPSILDAEPDEKVEPEKKPIPEWIPVDAATKLEASAVAVSHLWDHTVPYNPYGTDGDKSINFPERWPGKDYQNCRQWHSIKISFFGQKR